MKSKVSPTAIGVFIAGAIVILFASVVLFGSGRLFRQTKDLLLTFREPVTGLDVGAPVKLMGVTIGSVKDIAIEVDRDSTNLVMISVVVEIDRKNSQAAFRNYPIDLDDRSRFERTVKVDGMRGQLEVLSLLSGQLYIALGLFPGTEGFQLNREQDHGFWEVPTLPSTKQQMIQSLVTSLDNVAKLDFQSMSDQLNGLLGDLRADLASIQFGQIGTNLSQTLARAGDLLTDPQLRGAMTNLNSALAQFHNLGQNLNTRIDPVFAQLDADLKKAGAAFEEVTQTLRQLQAQVEPGSTLSRELIRALDEAGSTLSALRQLAQEVQRNPSSLITGKKETKP